MSPRARTPAGGFTMVESMISLIVTVVFVGVMYGVLLTTSRATATTEAASELDKRIHRTLDRIVETLILAGRETLAPPLPPADIGLTELTFQCAEGTEPDGSIRFGSVSRIELRYDPNDPDDGEDNDGDGLVDEGQIVFRTRIGEPEERTWVWASGVAEFAQGERANGVDDNGNVLRDERGLSFEVDGNQLVIRLTMEARTRSGLTLRRSAETSLTFRN